MTEEFTPTMFKIYVYLLKHNPQNVSVTKIAEDLNISRQLTHYYLKKLTEIGYVTHQKPSSKTPEEEWGYKIRKLAPIEPLKQYLYIANRYLIPRQAVYITIFFTLLCLSWLSPYPQLIQAITIIPLIYNLYELYKQEQKTVAVATTKKEGTPA
jgi:DNA-binding Lrp family transcriptional regulator